ncbi:MAG: methyltransferase domain-containing protein [Methanotrichaceae archaeon]
MSQLYAFELSGEHPTLPRSEAISLLEICSSGYREICVLDRCLVVEAKNLDLVRLRSRLAMTHRVIQVMAIADPNLEAIDHEMKDVSIPRLSYRVRAKRLGNATLFSNQVEEKIGSILWKRGYRADLNNPEIDLRAVITNEKAVLGLELFEVDRSGFQARRPHLKPFFHPGALLPKLARVLVNLSRVREGGWLFDPFSGTGGFLVEAGLMGIKGIGLDVQEEIVRGAEANLTGLDCNLIVGDARKFPLRDSSINGAVSDAPYGRSALIQAKSRNELVTQCLDELYRVLIPEKRMVFVDDRPIRNLVKDAGFEVIETHEDRVHRSLTRHIFVCRR